MKSLKMKSLIFVLTLFVMLYGKGAYGGNKISVSSEQGVYSKYVWRGFKLDDDAVFQSDLSVESNGFTLDVWGNTDIENDDNLNSDEFDVTLSYSFDKKPFSFTIGHTWYNFPAVDGDSKEFFATVEYDSFLSPYISWYRDYGDEEDGGGDGNYFEAGIGYTYSVEEMPLDINLSLSVSYNDELFIEGNGGNVLIGADFVYIVKEGVEVKLVNGYSIPYGDLSDSDDGNQDKEYYAGLSVALSL